MEIPNSSNSKILEAQSKKKMMKRLESTKSHSWWWDSHISPKNSKWLSDNLQDMDQNVKRMLKLIEEDADSFAKKAEMYYQKRPELISLVEDLYRMYRSLAERYDLVTGELRKNIASSDIQSQGSDIGSDFTSPDQKISRRKSGTRAAGFDVFLGSGGSNASEVYQKEANGSSSESDSDSESDASSVNNYLSQVPSGGDRALHRKIIELETELRQVNEKLQAQQLQNGDCSCDEKSEQLLVRIAAHEQELKSANEKIRMSEEETVMLKIDLDKYKSGFSNGFCTDRESPEMENSVNQKTERELELVKEVGTEEPDSEIQVLTEELRITMDKLEISKREVASLKQELEDNRDSEELSKVEDQLELAKKDNVSWKNKLNNETREVIKLQERIARLKSSLSDRDNEVRALKIAVSDAEEKIFPEKAQIKAEISRLLEEQTHLKELLREWESRGRSLEDDIRMAQTEKSDMEATLNGEIKQLKTSISTLQTERDTVNAEVGSLKAEVISKNKSIAEMQKHLHQLHLEYAELIGKAAMMHKMVGELRSRSEELEQEVERQKVVILEGAEKKREAIRQLCFSLEHYRSGYQTLRQATLGHKRVTVLAS